MKRKILLSNKFSTKIEINISSKILFSNNNYLGDNNMALKIKGETVTIDGQTYDLSNPNKGDAIDFLEYARVRPEPIRLPKKLEDIIAMFPNPATFYAAEVLNRRWKQAEVEIVKTKNVEYIIDYVTFVIEGPWPEMEDIIAQDAWASIEYAYVIQSRFIKGEKAIINSPQHFESYKKLLTRDIFSQFKRDNKL